MRSFLRYSLALLSFPVLLGGSPRAFADTISAFTLSSDLQYGTATGTLTVDTTTGVLTAASVTASYNGSSETLGTLVSATASSGLYKIKLTTASGGSGDYVYLDLPVSTLLNYAGGSIDTTSYNASAASYLFSSNYDDYATSGTLDLTSTTRTATSTAVTPEVASWVLTSSGTLLLIVVARRRRSPSQAPSASAA